eukprot:CAMPEP_0194309910 /NCGR_PEP_ID=MMETSP0171-20130528/6881_1 /TAXON_ID=218684 /ORGANISM="Corethron pennatum, Strain L29A3" /LENGTH=135 /DNA_ID=CAMNT_0039063295 /DNA_START=201 /DNA_END=609 /DNA_ORIENTATION=-
MPASELVENALWSANGVPFLEMRAGVGRNPTIPVAAAGTSIDPHTSTATASGTHPVTTSAALPEAPPPQDRSLFQGLATACPVRPRTNGTAPASRSVATTSASDAVGVPLPSHVGARRKRRGRGAPPPVSAREVS